MGRLGFNGRPPLDGDNMNAQLKKFNASLQLLTTYEMLGTLDFLEEKAVESTEYAIDIARLVVDYFLKVPGSGSMGKERSGGALQWHVSNACPLTLFPRRRRCRLGSGLCF